MAGYVSKREFSTLKGRLTRAINSKDPAKVIAECDHAFAVFGDRAWPDDWARWQRAKDDALFEQRRRSWR